MPDQDRESIGLTTDGQRMLGVIEDKGWFLDGQDIARFCMAYAIKEHVPEGATNGTETRWAAGNFDKTGEIRSLLAALYPECSTPIRLMEHLVNEGLRLVNVRLISALHSPADLIQSDQNLPGVK